jgi:DNA-binding response OmpR family regulator
MNSGRRRSVLVVEDEPALQTSLSAYLTLHDFETFRASSVDDALKVLGRENIDAVTLDVSLPDEQGMQRTGFTLLTFLRATAAYKNLPVVIFTGVPLAPDDEQHALQLGAAVIYKPQPFGVLLESLSRLLDPRR